MASSTITALTANAQTGNNTHAGVLITKQPLAIALVLVIEAVGATPTITWKFQGSFDDLSAASPIWEDVLYITGATDTGATATQVKTAVGKYAVWLANATSRWYPYIRLVTTSNTNVTYHGEVWIPIGDS